MAAVGQVHAVCLPLVGQRPRTRCHHRKYRSGAWTDILRLRRLRDRRRCYVGSGHRSGGVVGWIGIENAAGNRRGVGNGADAIGPHDDGDGRAAIGIDVTQRASELAAVRRPRSLAQAGREEGDADRQRVGDDHAGRQRRAKVSDGKTVSEVAAPRHRVGRIGHRNREVGAGARAADETLTSNIQLEAVNRAGIRGSRVGDAQFPGSVDRLAVEGGKQCVRFIAAGEGSRAAGDGGAGSIVKHGEDSRTIAGAAAIIVARTAALVGQRYFGAIGMDEREHEIGVVGVIQSHANVHIRNRARIRDSNRHLNRGVVGDRYRDAAAAVTGRDRRAQRAQCECVGEGAQIDRAILQLEHRREAAAAGAGGREGEGAGHSRAAGNECAVALRAARGSHTTRGQQRRHQANGVAAAHVLQGEVDGDHFGGIDGAIGRHTPVRNQPGAVDDDDRRVRTGSEGHRRPARAEMVQDHAGRCAIPPPGARAGRIAETIAIAGGRIAEVIQVLGVAAVGVVLKMPEVVRLHQGHLVVEVGGVKIGALVVFVPQFVNVPDGDACRRQTGVATALLTVLHQVILGGHTRFDVAIKLVEIGAGRGDCRREVRAAGQFDGRSPARGAFQVSADLHRVAAGAAVIHQAECPGTPVRVVAVVVNVRVAAQHVAVLVAKGAQRQRGAYVGDLVFVNLLSVAQVNRAGQAP